MKKVANRNLLEASTTKSTSESSDAGVLQSEPRRIEAYATNRDAISFTRQAHRTKRWL